MGLKADGSIRVWGSSTYGVQAIPFPNANFVAIAAGSAHCMGLKADGTVVCWGAGMYPPSGDPTFPEFGQSVVPAGLAGVMAIAAGNNHIIVLRP